MLLRVYRSTNASAETNGGLAAARFMNIDEQNYFRCEVLRWLPRFSNISGYTTAQTQQKTGSFPRVCRFAQA